MPEFCQVAGIAVGRRREEIPALAWLGLPCLAVPCTDIYAPVLLVCLAVQV